MSFASVCLRVSYGCADRERLIKVRVDISDADAVVAEEIVRSIAPSEVPLLRQLVRRPTLRDRFGSKSVGYGVDVDVTVIAPYALLAATWARSVVVGEAKVIIEKRLKRLTRRLLGEKEEKQVQPPASPTPPLNASELEDAVEQYALQLGLKKDKARLLANAVVGRVLSTKRA